MRKGKVQDDWEELLDFLPETWLELAEKHGALKGLKKDKSADCLLRTMLLHCACGYSLRETSARARAAGLAAMSDVALMKRMKKCGPWFQAMSLALLREKMAASAPPKGMRFRVFDATHVEEPGPSGSQWRMHYSVCLPDLECDSFTISSAKGRGAGESLCKFPVSKGDTILADRIYCRGEGLAYVASKGAFITVRLQPNAVIITDRQGEAFDLIGALEQLTEAGEVGEWDVLIRGKNSKPTAGRICAMLKTKENAERSRRKAIEKSRKNCCSVQEETLLYANYIIVFTTFGDEHTAKDILRYYRLRWQIELVFKRFKQIAEFGHLPKYNDESSKAWLYGKLFVAFLTEKLIAYGGAISPWRDCNDRSEADNESLPGIFFYISSDYGGDTTNHRFARNTFKLA